MSRDLAIWHKEEIKAALRMKFGSLSALAMSWGYSEHVISGVLSRKRFSIPVEIRISKALDVPLHDLWPDRWEPNGTPKRRPRVVSTRGCANPNSKKREAA